jgi:hypothetical protein
LKPAWNKRFAGTLWRDCIGYPQKMWTPCHWGLGGVRPASMQEMLRQF